MTLAPTLAAGEGFEPSQTESESVVLPLHNPAISTANSIIAILTEMSTPIIFPSRIVFFYSSLYNGPAAPYN